MKTKHRIFKASLLPLMIMLAGCAMLHSKGRSRSRYSVGDRPETDVVQLRYATLPSALRILAVHHWFAVFDADKGEWSRWECWQKPDVHGQSWGHVHVDLMHADSGVGGGGYVVEREWRGSTARDIISVLNVSSNYPYLHKYRSWPGPNSNTYAAWVLKRAKVPVDLHPMAIGKDYLGAVGASVSGTRTGVQVESPVIGIKAGLGDGLEIHLFCATLGVDVWPPALKTPFGRLGFPE